MALSMDLRLFEAFVVTVELGSISRAAARLELAQPSLSAQIRQLEHQLGTPLLTRLPRGVVPTAAGREIYACATDVLARVEASRQQLVEWAEDVAGTVRAGVIPTLSKGLLPRLLPGFVARHPRVELRVLEAYTGTLVDAVLADELDFAIVMMPRRETALANLFLAEDELVVVAGPAAKLPADAALDLAALPPQKLVMPSQRHSLRSMLDRMVDDGTLAVSRTVEMDGLLGTLKFLRHSDFIALLPRMSVADEMGDASLLVRTVGAPACRFKYSLVHRRRSPLSRFAQVLATDIAEALAATQ